MSKLPHKYYSLSNNSKVRGLISRDDRIKELEDGISKALSQRDNCNYVGSTKTLHSLLLATKEATVLVRGENVPLSDFDPQEDV